MSLKCIKYLVQKNNGFELSLDIRDHVKSVCII